MEELARTNPTDIHVDDSGYVYVSGLFRSTVDFDPSPSSTFNITSMGNSDAFIAKYDGNGNFIWAGSVGSAAADYSIYIDVDDFGNVFFGGNFEPSIDLDPDTSSYILYSHSPTSPDYYIGKWTNQGKFSWGHSFGGQSWDFLTDVLVDHNNDVYCTGRFWDTVDFDPDTGTFNMVNVGRTSSGGGCGDVYLQQFTNNGKFKWAGMFGSTSCGYGGGLDENFEL